MKTQLVALLILISQIAYSADRQPEQRFAFSYADLFSSEASMLATAKAEADYINTHLLAPHRIEIVILSSRKHDMSMHTITGVIRGKDCSVNSHLFRKTNMPRLRRGFWTEMILGVGIVWPLMGQNLETYRADYVLIPVCD